MHFSYLLLFKNLFWPKFFFHFAEINLTTRGPLYTCLILFRGQSWQSSSMEASYKSIKDEDEDFEHVPLVGGGIAGTPNRRERPPSVMWPSLVGYIPCWVLIELLYFTCNHTFTKKSRWFVSTAGLLDRV